MMNLSNLYQRPGLCFLIHVYVPSLEAIAQAQRKIVNLILQKSSIAGLSEIESL